MISKEEAMKLIEMVSEVVNIDYVITKARNAGLVEPDKKSKLQEARDMGDEDLNVVDALCNRIRKYEAVIKEYQEIAEKGIKMIRQDYYFSHQLVGLLKQITEDK